MYGPRCNGFKLRGLNADCDRVAVQSSEQTTWQLGRKRGGLGMIQWHEVAIQQNEIMVLRAYGGAPSIEIKPLGDKAGVLIIQPARGRTRAVRVGTREVIELDRDESCVIRCEWIQYPKHPGVSTGAYGPGLAV